ncbi:MAG: hypothetical protein IJ897_09285 [Prevotella sp.]|nr:hypothetical protein [Prevotella sp.]
MGAQNDVPIIEIKADRAMIYPQRMELTGEETLMDILQMMPELMIAGYEDVIGIYNLRIDNCPVNGDTRLILSQMKAKDIAKIQVCDNTGVAKGTIGMGRVMDINMKMPEKVKGFVEGQGDFGKDAAGIGTVNALYGSKGTDLYANTSYRHQDAERIIRTKLTHEQVQAPDEEIDPAMAGIESDEASPTGRTKRISTNEQEFQQYAKASYCILLVMGGGTILSWLFKMTGVTFPTYFGALILAAIARNTIGFVKYKENGKWVKADKHLDMERIVSVGNICLSLFLGMAMISLKLWELQSLALPLIVILISQVVLMALFAYMVAFPLLGRDYDAAVLCAGMCGFGLGATPNAMANMSAVCYKYRYTVKPFLIVPIIGAMFADLINTGIISLFLNFL